MAWLAAPSTEGTITESVKYLVNYMSIIFGTSTAWKQSRTITVKRYVGLTQAAAETQAGVSALVANCTDAHTEATGGGSYAAIETIDAVGEWEKVV